jgi:hypothetical protein
MSRLNTSSRSRIRPGRPPVDLAELDLEEAAARELERLHIDIRAAA